MDSDYDIEKFLPAMIARLGAGAAKYGKKGLEAAKKVGVAAKNSKMGQNMANLAEKGKEMKDNLDEMRESPMGQAMGSLQEAAARNQQDTTRMEQEARERMMSGASTGSTTTRS